MPDRLRQIGRRDSRRGTGPHLRGYGQQEPAGRSGCGRSGADPGCGCVSRSCPAAPLPETLAAAAPTSRLIETYAAYIGDDDLHNSSGDRLTQPWAILRQDRANYHRFGKRQGADQPELVFRCGSQPRDHGADAAERQDRRQRRAAGGARQCARRGGNLWRGKPGRLCACLGELIALTLSPREPPRNRSNAFSQVQHCSLGKAAALRHVLRNWRCDAV